MRRHSSRVPERRFASLAEAIVPWVHALRSFRNLRFRAWRLEGPEASSGEPLAVICAADEQTRHYLSHLLFGDGAREVDLGRVWLWQLLSGAWARKRGCTLVMIEAYEPIPRLLDEDVWFRIPIWINGTATLPVSSDVLKHKSLGSDFRRAREHGLHGRVTKESGCFDDFYHNMYVPHVIKAHGSSVHVTPYDAMKARMTDGELILISDGERDIAGMTIVYDDGSPRFWSMGVRDGDREFLKRGALTALFDVATRHLTAKHFDSVSLGLSRAFLNDGVLLYKRKWAHRLEAAVPGRIALRAVAATPASKSFLHNNPFIFEQSGKFYGAVFAADESPPTADHAVRLKKQHFHHGLSQVILFSCDGSRALDLNPDPVRG
jgi:hypothetical protein